MKTIISIQGHNSFSVLPNQESSENQREACMVNTVPLAHTQFKVANLVSEKIAFPAKFRFQVSCCCSAEIQI